MDLWGISAVAWFVSLLGAAPGGPGCLALASLDLQRSAAYAAESVEEITRLYVDETAAAPDVAVLRNWSERGFRLPAAMLVIGSCQATATAERLDLEVIDRLAPTVAVEATGRHTGLPHDDWSLRVVTLVQVDGVWRYAASTP